MDDEGRKGRKNRLSGPSPEFARGAEENMLDLLNRVASGQALESAGVVIDQSRRIALSTVLSDARHLAEQLRSGGLVPGEESTVVIALPRSRALVTAYLGVFLAGGVFVPVDPAHPLTRLLHVVTDCGAGWMITDNAELTQAVSGVKVLTSREILNQGPYDGRFEPPVLRPSCSAYIVYTSGTTGTSKGVVIEHANLEALLRWHVDFYPLGPDPCVSLTASPGFDVSIWDHFLAFCTGASIHIVTDDERLDPQCLQRSWLEHGVTQSFVAPQLADQLIRLDWNGDAGRMRYLFCGGDRLQSRPPARFPIPLVNAYGPAECTVVSTAGVVAPLTTANEGLLPDIGRPLPAVRALVLDQNMQPVERGESGVLWLTGAQVGRGYLNLPELTAQRFRDDIRVEEGVVRAYLTGDIVSENPDGTLAFHGRADDQVKVDGVRIELGDIESAVGSHPSVTQAAAVPVIHPRTGVTRICATVVAPPDVRPEDVKAWAAARLPHQVVPIAVHVVAALPITQNGKTDRAALKQVHEAALGRQLTHRGTSAAPADDELIAIASAVLGVAVTREDDLLALGLDSLSALRLAHLIKERLGLQMSVREVLQAQTLAGLVTKAKPVTVVEQQNMLDDQEWHPAAPLSSGLWFYMQLHRDAPTYNIGATFLLPEQLDVDPLRMAVDRLFRDDPGLRLAFRELPGRIVQQRAQRHGPELLDAAFQVLPTQASIPAALVTASSAYRRPFRMDQAPLVRVVYAPTRPQGSLLQLVGHHSVVDGISLSLLLQRLTDHYHSRGTAPRIAPGGAAGYAAWQAERAASPQTRTYWQAQGPGFQPPDLVSAARPGDGGAIAEYISGSGLGTRVRSHARMHRTTTFPVLLAAWARALCELEKQDDVTIGVPLHGRTLSSFVDQVGCFAGVVPVTLTSVPSQDPWEVARQATLHCEHACEHNGLSLGEIVTLALGPRGRVTDAVTCTFSEKLDLRLDGLGGGGAFVEMDTGRSRFPLSAFFRVQDDVVVGHLEYQTEAIEQTRLDEFVDRFFLCLSDMCAPPDETGAAMPGGGALGGGATAPGREATTRPGVTPAVPTSPPVRHEILGIASVEHLTKGLWCEVLEVESLEPDADFFELGGDSIAVHRLAQRLAEAGISMQIGDFFANPRIDMQIAMIERALNDTLDDRPLVGQQPHQEQRWEKS